MCFHIKAAFILNIFYSISDDNSDQQGNFIKRSWQFVWSRVKLTAHSWKLYWTSDIREAGISLALIYMTVLGFDNITYGYCLDQCVTESALGGLVGLSAVFGNSSFRLFTRMTN